LETSPYNYLAFKLVLTNSIIENFIIDNNIDILAFVAYIRKTNDVETRFIKNTINNKNDIYYKEILINRFRKLNK
jgi:predicted component of type VI protein secretion system